MIRKEDCERRAEELLIPICEANGLELVDVEYVKEGSARYLRAYLDKPGGIKINDCEAASRAWEAELDKADFIEDAYTLIHLFRADPDKKKEYIGMLDAFDAETVTIVLEDETKKTFARKDISLARPYIDFSDF